MTYDIILVVGERFFDHPLCGTAIIKRLLEKYGYSTGLIAEPQSVSDITRLGKPKLFFGVSSGSIDSMLRNYTPLKKDRHTDPHQKSKGAPIPNRALLVYTNWIKERFKETPVILGGVEATMRRFAHYDYWDNKVRRSILPDSKADLLVYGNAEKQVLEIAKRQASGEKLDGIEGTCIMAGTKPDGFTTLPSFEEALTDTGRFCDLQNALSIRKPLAQATGNRFVLQYPAPRYTTADLDEYYELPFSREMPGTDLQGFTFSLVTHRGCIGGCNFCSLSHTQGDRIVSRSEGSILNEVRRMVKMAHFKGNIDDIGGASANMYGMDCQGCTTGDCLDCGRLDKSHSRLMRLLKKVRDVPEVNRVWLRSGIRFDLATEAYLKEIVEYHIFDTLRIAPEHVNKRVLKLMNKDRGDLDQFLHWFKKTQTYRKLSFYFMTAHPGSGPVEARELADAMGKFDNAETFQVFTPTPMTVSTCMYHTEMDPVTREPLHVPRSYIEKKDQKRLILDRLPNRPKRGQDSRVSGPRPKAGFPHGPKPAERPSRRAR